MTTSFSYQIYQVYAKMEADKSISTNHPINYQVRIGKVFN